MHLSRGVGPPGPRISSLSSVAVIKHWPRATSEEERVYWLVAYRPPWRAAKTLTPGSNLEKALEQRPQWIALSWLVLHGLLRLVCYMTQDHLPQDSSTVSIACVKLTQTNQLTLFSVFCFWFFCGFFFLDSVNSPMSIYRKIYMYTCVQIQVLFWFKINFLSFVINRSYLVKELKKCFCCILS